MTDLSKTAEEAYQALCRFEDELDRALFDRAVKKADRRPIERVLRRWQHDTYRKIERALT